MTGLESIVNDDEIRFLKYLKESLLQLIMYISQYLAFDPNFICIVD